jgi:hypothetical protein
MPPRSKINLEKVRASDADFAARDLVEVFGQLSHVSFGNFRRVGRERSGVARVVPQLLNSVIQHEHLVALAAHPDHRIADANDFGFPIKHLTYWMGVV